MNILDYIDWRGDITFSERGLNEVDNLIFSTLAYLKMDGLIPEAGLSLAGLYEAYRASGYDQSSAANDPLPLLSKASRSSRFRDVWVRWYINKINPEQQIQFSAVTFCYDTDRIYIAFRGTDNTIVGWREDCNLSFLPETPGQREAAAYVDRIADLTSARLTVGGHSKGGNFAVYAAAFCRPEIRDGRIDQVYSNDGPGFKAEVTRSPGYLKILDKTCKIIPDSSLVGILLSSRAERKVIRSDAKGVQQHNPYSWCVLGVGFEPADERTARSIFMDDTLSRWVEAMSDENKQILVTSVFDALEASGMTTLSEINANKRLTYPALIKAIGSLDAADKSDIAASIKKLLESGRDTAKAEARTELEKRF